MHKHVSAQVPIQNPVKLLAVLPDLLVSTVIQILQFFPEFAAFREIFEFFPELLGLLLYH